MTSRFPPFAFVELVSPYNKKNITRWLQDMNFVLVARTISHSFAALTREILFLPLEHKIHIFSSPCNILYLFGGFPARTEEPRDVNIMRLIGSNVFSCQSHITDLSTPEYWNWSRGSAANLSTSCAILLCSCLARASTWTSWEQIFCCMYCKSLQQNTT